MATTTIGFGVALIALGLAGYFGTGAASLTALIPSAFGVLLAVFGFIAKDEAKRKHAMHAAVLVGLIGCLAALPRPLRALASGSEVTAAIGASLTMSALLAIYVALCVRSFIEARKRRSA